MNVLASAEFFLASNSWNFFIAFLSWTFTLRLRVCFLLFTRLLFNDVLRLGIYSPSPVGHTDDSIKAGC